MVRKRRKATSYPTRPLEAAARPLPAAPTAASPSAEREYEQGGMVYRRPGRTDIGLHRFHTDEKRLEDNSRALETYKQGRGTQEKELRAMADRVRRIGDSWLPAGYRRLDREWRV